MSFTTEQVFTYSGAAASGRTFFTAPYSDNLIRNSGGIVNITGPVLVRTIEFLPASGRYTDATLSGIVLSVIHSTSGMFTPLSGEVLFFEDLEAHSGLADGNVVHRPVSNVTNHIARSGVTTLNSGTHIFDIIVRYTNFVA